MIDMVDAVGTTKYTYCAGGLLNTEDGPWSNDTVTNTYNNARLRSGLLLQQPAGTWTNGFGYDSAHRLTTVTFSAGTFTYTYKGPGTLVTNLALPNTAKITNAYDTVARLTGTYLTHSNGTVLNKHEYLYNTGNQRTRVTRTDGNYFTNSYDNIGQLVWANSTVNTEDCGYLYDAAWNLNQRTNFSGVTTYSVDSRNQLSSFASTWAAGYDGNGNLTSRTNGGNLAYSYSYDDENQLINVVYQDPAVANSSWWRSDFVYDGRGRLRQRQDYTWYGGNPPGWITGPAICYIYDGMRVIQERDAFNTPTVSYTRGSDLSGTLEGAGGIGGLLARSHGYSSGSWTNHNFYHADGNGNITYLVNSSQSVAAIYRYDPFGNPVSTSGTLASANTYRFSSKERHPNSGMYYYGYRWYDPNLQRWLNRDPIGEKGGLNLYVYVRNAPFTFIDSFGHGIIGYCCARATAGGVLTTMGQAPINNRDDKGGGNAFLHCVIACQISKDCGSDGRSSWDSRENANTGAGRQDLANNQVGYGNASKEGSCWDNCMNSWINGELTCSGGANKCPPPKERIPEPVPPKPPAN